MPTAPKLAGSPDRHPRDWTLPDAFSCSSYHTGADVTFVHARGELDVAASPTLAALLRGAQSQASVVVLDLAGVTLMDSSGVHVIVDASRDARRVGRRLVVLPGRPSVDRLFTLTETRGDVDIRDAAAAA